MTKKMYIKISKEVEKQYRKEVEQIINNKDFQKLRYYKQHNWSDRLMISVYMTFTKSQPMESTRPSCTRKLLPKTAWSILIFQKKSATPSCRICSRLALCQKAGRHGWLQSLTRCVRQLNYFQSQSLLQDTEKSALYRLRLNIGNISKKRYIF